MQGERNFYHRERVSMLLARGKLCLTVFFSLIKNLLIVLKQKHSSCFFLNTIRSETYGKILSSCHNEEYNSLSPPSSVG
ncbi:hypothetical protein XELAEV_18011561mg [Xenopus laevis]|uniref:Uncharacterized protein n=1 Tax=Xenopus laevis TaxID=8355 RepID=A0A974HXK9_XENLA|nr:hypothetical protein XELAEV_18011561mg [Xenopus laevis]